MSSSLYLKRASAYLKITCSRDTQVINSSSRNTENTDFRGSVLATLLPSYRKASHSGSRMSLGRLSTKTTRNQLKVMRDTSTLCSSKWAASRGSFSARKSFSTRWSAWGNNHQAILGKLRPLKILKSLNEGLMYYILQVFIFFPSSLTGVWCIYLWPNVYFTKLCLSQMVWGQLHGWAL